jgi:signal transduction histidine kinase
MIGRRKSLLTYFLLFLAPMLFLSAINYWHAKSTLNSGFSRIAQDNLNTLIGELDHQLREGENSLARLSLSQPLQNYVSNREGEATPKTALATATSNAQREVPDDVRFDLLAAFSGRPRFRRVTVYARDKLVPVLQAERGNNSINFGRVSFRTGNFSPAELNNDSMFSGKSSLHLTGTTLHFTVPVIDASTRVSALLSGEAQLDEMISEIAGGVESREGYAAGPPAIIVAVDSSGTILYHSNHVLQGQTIANATPELMPLATTASANQGGNTTLQMPSGEVYATAFGPLPSLRIALAFGRNQTELMGNSRFWLFTNIVLSILASLALAFLVEYLTQRRSKGIVRVTEDLSAIAKGELDRRIELRSSDDARGLADNINVVTDRLRAQIAHEAESRQFESFVRLSAMLTHDLKNAIEALSLTVGNMERHFDNEQFRSDAMKSVAGATDKLKNVVARLSRPLTSLSGEHKRPVRVDLVPVLRRTVQSTVGSVPQKHEIRLDLPPKLEAIVNAERIEPVIENLVINALEAMADKPGVLSIGAKGLPDNRVQFSVSDTGPGMSRTFIEQKLFRPFATTKRKGIGLGLYTCRETVQADGGSIEVESVEGTGTTFRVVLPSPPSDGR